MERKSALVPPRELARQSLVGFPPHLDLKHDWLDRLVRLVEQYYRPLRQEASFFSTVVGRALSYRTKCPGALVVGLGSTSLLNETASFTLAILEASQKVYHHRRKPPQVESLNGNYFSSRKSEMDLLRHYQQPGIALVCFYKTIEAHER